MHTTPPPNDGAAILAGVPDHDDRGAYVIIATSGFIAFATNGEPARLCRATPNPDASITLRTVGATFARLDLAVDAGHWYAEREAHANAAAHVCRRCGNPIEQINGVWAVVDYTTTAGGLSYCPPNPDAARVSTHIPRKRDPR